jgi:hypothetical protein
LSPEIFGHWVHSHEEDRAGEEVYHPLGWRFPLARGRSAFEISPDGEFVEHGPGPADVSVARKGRWQVVTADRITVSLPGGKSYELHFTSVAPDLLKLTR